MWMSTVVPGFSPTEFTQLTTYTPCTPRSEVWIERDAAEDGATYESARSWTGSGPVPTTATVATGGGGDAASTTDIVPASQAPQQTSGPTKEEPLSPGAKIGIGVSVGLGVPIILLLSIIALYAMRKQSRTQQETGALFVPPSTTHEHPITAASAAAVVEDCASSDSYQPFPAPAVYGGRRLGRVEGRTAFANNATSTDRVIWRWTEVRD